MRVRGTGIENRAEAHLNARGLETVARNHACRGGEIDLVMLDGDTLVFVEVRFRSSTRYGSAAESVDARKQARLVLAARHFLASRSEFAHHPCRFDVVAASGAVDAPRIDWISGAFSA